MRLRTGNPKMARRSAILFVAAASFALTSCAAEQGRLAQLRAPPYFALYTGDEPGVTARQTGHLSEENGCVVFRPADSSPAMTPVFRKGETALVTDGQDWLGLYVNDAPVAMQKVYRLSGAKVDRAAPLGLTAPVPGDCPSTYFVVHSVAKSVADGNANRFCAGVTICRAFGVD